jgi:hypothetical protein
MRKLFIIGVALALMVGFTATAMAAAGPSVTLGARVNQRFAYNFSSEERNSSGEDITQQAVALVGNSYWRAKFLSADKKVGVMVELGLPNANTRFAYGWYKIGNCTLYGGQKGDYFYAYFPDGSRMSVVAGDAIGWGHPYHGRHPQVALEWASGNFGVYFSLQTPPDQTGSINQGSAATPVDFGAADQYATLPAVHLGFKFKTAMFSTQPAFLWTQTKWEGLASGVDDDVQCWGAWLPLQFKAGGFTVLLQGHYIVNPTGVWSSMPSFAGPSLSPDGSFGDTTNLGGLIQLKYTMGALDVYAGFGYENFNNDDWKDQLGWSEDDNSRMLYYLGMAYRVHKYFIIYPEFNYNDYGDAPQSGSDLGNEWVIGVLLRFIF